MNRTAAHDAQDIEQLKAELTQARTRLSEMSQGAKHYADSAWPAMAAYKAISNAEIALAKAQKKPYAVEMDFGVTPEAAISGGMLFQDDYHTYIAFNAMRARPDGMCEPVGLAIVELHCGTTKFGYPNDEARPGHPLAERGLGGYGIYEVFNSAWIDEQLKINRVRFPETKRNPSKRHFMFTFHDSTLECTGYGITLEIPPYSPRFQALYEVIQAWGKFTEFADAEREAAQAKEDAESEEEE